MCDLCPVGLRGYALGLEEAMRKLMPDASLRREAAIARAFADRLEERGQAGLAEAVAEAAPSLTLGEPPALVAEAAAVGGAPKREAGASGWSEERRAAYRERMKALNDRRKAAAAEEGEGDTVEEWLVSTLLDQGVPQDEIDMRILQMSPRVLLNTANAHRRKLGLPEFAAGERTAA